MVAFVESSRFGYYVSNPDGTLAHRIDDTRRTRTELDELRDCMQVIFDVLPIVMAFEALDRNHTTLHLALHQEEAKLANLPHRALFHGARFRDAFVETTRHAMNFLGTANAFLDQVERHLEEAWGKASQELVAWNTQRMELHSSRFSYRLLYKLRNFSQHIGLPITDLGFKGRGASTAAVTYQVSILLDRDKLLSTKFDWGKVKPEIEAQPAKFALLPLIDEHMQSLRLLFCLALHTHSGRMVEAGQYVERMRRMLNAPSNAVLMVWEGDSVTANAPPRTEYPIPVVELQRVTELYAAQCKPAPPR